MVQKYLDVTRQARQELSEFCKNGLRQFKENGCGIYFDLGITKEGIRLRCINGNVYRLNAGDTYFTESSYNLDNVPIEELDESTMLCVAKLIEDTQKSLTISGHESYNKLEEPR